MSTVRQVLSREASTGMRQLVGTRLTAAIEVSEIALEEALRHSRALPATLTVRLVPGNRIVVRYGALHATAVLATNMDLRGPRIDLELRSTLFAWALRRAVAMPAVSVAGRRVTIDLSRLDGLQDFASIWPHFRAVQFATADGALFVHVEIAVT